MPGQVERKFACACSFAIKLSTKESMGVLFNSWIKKLQNCTLIQSCRTSLKEEKNYLPGE